MYTRNPFNSPVSHVAGNTCQLGLSEWIRANHFRLNKIICLSWGRRFSTLQITAKVVFQRSLLTLLCRMIQFKFSWHHQSVPSSFSSRNIINLHIVSFYCFYSPIRVIVAHRERKSFGWVVKLGRLFFACFKWVFLDCRTMGCTRINFGKKFWGSASNVVKLFETFKNKPLVVFLLSSRYMTLSPHVSSIFIMV